MSEPEIEIQTARIRFAAGTVPERAGEIARLAVERLAGMVERGPMPDAATGGGRVVFVPEVEVPSGEDDEQAARRIAAALWRALAGGRP